MTDPKELADLLQEALDTDLGSGSPYVRLSVIFVKELEMVLRSVAQPEGTAITLATEKGLTPIGHVVEALTQIANWPDEDSEWDAVDKYAKVRDIANVALEHFETTEQSKPQGER